MRAHWLSVSRRHCPRAVPLPEAGAGLPPSPLVVPLLLVLDALCRLGPPFGFLPRSGPGQAGHRSPTPLPPHPPPDPFQGCWQALAALTSFHQQVAVSAQR